MHPMQNHTCTNEVVHEQHYATTLIGLHDKVSYPQKLHLGQLKQTPWPTSAINTAFRPLETDMTSHLCY